MSPIRDGFNEVGHERFEGEWTGEEIAFLDNWPTTAALAGFSPSERGAFDRCTAVITFLTQELEAGRAVAVTTDARHRRHDVAAEHWRDSAYDGRWQDGGENLAEDLTDRGTSRFIRFPAVKATVGAGPGAPTKYEKEDLRKRFDAHCAEVGFPGESNERGWRTQADVARWLVEQIWALEGRNADPQSKAVKTYAKEFMERVKT